MRIQVKQRREMAVLRITLLTVSLIVCLQMPVAESGECCLARADQSDQWCEVYCCSLPGAYGSVGCCSEMKDRVADEKRASVCGAWFRAHVWAPITIAIVGLLLIVCCCCLCCCNAIRSSGSSGYRYNFRTVNLLNRIV